MLTVPAGFAKMRHAPKAVSHKYHNYRVLCFSKPSKEQAFLSSLYQGSHKSFCLKYYYFLGTS